MTDYNKDFLNSNLKQAASNQQPATWVIYFKLKLNIKIGMASTRLIQKLIRSIVKYRPGQPFPRKVKTRYEHCYNFVDTLLKQGVDGW